MSVLRMKLVGANPRTRVVGLVSRRVNSITSSATTKANGIETFRLTRRFVTSTPILKSIGLLGNQKQLEYDFVIVRAHRRVNQNGF